MPTVSKFWTEAKIARMVELADSGKSGRQIAFEVRAPTRNYVIGMCQRMGIKLKGKAPEQPLKPGSRKHRKAQAFAFPGRRPAPGLEPFIMPPEPLSGGVTFADLDKGMCKWPTRSGFFCGEATSDRYCVFHAAKSRPVAA